MRWLRIAILLFALLLGCGAALWLMATQSGLQALVALASREQCQARSATGRLVGPLSLQDISCRIGSADIRIAEASLDWRLADLLRGRLTITSLEARDIQVHISAIGKKAAAFSGLDAPLDVDIHNARLERLDIARAGQSVHVTSARLAGDWSGDRINLKAFGVQTTEAEILLAGKAGTRPGSTLQLEAQWRVARGGYSELHGTAQFGGTLENIQYALTSQMPAPLHATGKLRWITAPLRWETRLDVESLAPQRIREGWPNISLSGQLLASGDTASWTHGGALSLHSASLGKWRATFAGQGSPAQWRIQTFDLAQSGGPVRIQGKGSWDVPSPQAEGGVFAVQARWKDMQLPLRGQAVVSSHDATLELHGSLDRYRYRIEGDLTAPRVPPSFWKMAGTGGRTGFVADRLDIDWLEGSWIGTGLLDWKPALKWQVQLDGQRVNPGVVWPDLPGQLNGLLTFDGAVRNGEVFWSGSLAEVAGTLREQPARGFARAAYRRGAYTLDALNVEVGSARIAGAGTFGDTLDMRWRLEAKHLSDLSEKAGGSVVAEASLRGARQAPQVLAGITGYDLEWEDYRLGALDASIAADIGAGEFWDINARATTLALRDQQIFDHLEFTSTGDTGAHRFQVESSGPILNNLLLRGQGAWTNNTWDALLTEGTAVTPHNSEWTQDQPASVHLSAANYRLDDFCWRHAEGKACAFAHAGSPTEWMAGASLDNLPLEILRPWLPSYVQLNGELNGTAHFAQRTAQPPEINLDLSSRDGHIRYQPGGDAPALDKPYRELSLRAHSDTGGLHTGATLEFFPGQEAKVELNLPEWRTEQPFAPQQRIAGHVDVALSDLELLPLIVPELSQPQGRLRAHLTLAGTLQAPRALGKIEATDATLAIPRLGIAVRDINLQATASEPSVFDLKGSAASGPGMAKLSGQINLANLAAWEGNVLVQGNRIEVMRLPLARVLVDPDLKATVAPNKIHLSGKLSVPEALVTLRRFTPPVTVSPDVIVLGAKTAEKTSPWRWSADMLLDLGEDVQLRDPDFTAQITGRLAIKADPPSPVDVRGEVQIPKGTYRAYGQELEIDQGRLLFVGGAYTNPGIDVRATRTRGEVQAGIIATGRLATPELQLFSKPAMEQTDILSYLVLGQPMSQATTAQGDLLYQAATGLGTATGELLARDIAGRFGIQEVRIETSQELNETALILGTQLSPRLYIRYALGVIGDMNALLIRYKLSRSWTMETTTTGVQSGADLLYTIEK